MTPRKPTPEEKRLQDEYRAARDNAGSPYPSKATADLIFNNPDRAWELFDEVDKQDKRGKGGNDGKR